MQYEEYERYVIFEFFCGYLINLSKSKSKFVKEVKDKVNDSIYSECFKNLDTKTLSTGHLVVYTLLKFKLYVLIYILCKFK